MLKEFASGISPRRFAFLKRKAARADTAGKLSEVIFRPGGATEISRWWSEAQPPGQVEEDCSRPGRDAGPEFATGPIPVLCPFRDRLKSPHTGCDCAIYTVVLARTSSGLRGGRSRQETDDAFAIDDDGQDQVLHFGAQSTSIPHPPPVVPAH